MTEPEAILVKATNVVALGGVVSPVWLPMLDTVSQVSATFIPILSVVWLLLQIWRFVFTKKGQPK